MTNRTDEIWKIYRIMVDMFPIDELPSLQTIMADGYTEKEGEDLLTLLGQSAKEDAELPQLDRIDGEVALSFISDLLYSDFEGWRDEHKVALTLFVRELRWYAYNAMNPAPGL